MIDRWKSPNGYKELLTIAFPLILSSASWSIMHFIDRLFLSWYSAESIAAAMPAGILNFTLMSLFIGAAAYVTTFVAQYTGADQKLEIGTYLWQGIYLSLAGTALISLCIPLAPYLFSFFGHDKAIAADEVLYFQALCLGAFPCIVNSALSSFYSGRGSTMPIMLVNVMMSVINIILDYIMIFGRFGCPEMGIWGAGIATTISAYAGMAVYIVLIFRPKYEKLFGVFSRFQFKAKAFWRLLSYGIPSGFQLFMDVAGFTAFIILVGRLGKEALGASNIAFSINTLAFMPMVGLGTAVSVLVGQAMGRQVIKDAQTVTFSGFQLALFYMTSISILYTFTPGIFLNPFVKNTAESAGLIGIAIILLRFIALYSVFDSFGVIFGSALKGAGDTRFIMVINILYSFCFLIIPTYVMIVVLKWNIYFAWLAAAVYVSMLALTFFVRFQAGQWKKMTIIERDETKALGNTPETPIPTNL